ncbi:MAG: NAD(P)/FAD-dependent oxidoreductase [Gammaproteobacteria bacterium]|nr:NAD(P)/FAD-dependent oxidoreductase [Gammaproteobacteria bacterium]
MNDKRDLVVVGAGFAGLACAKRAAERGLSVLVIDQQPSPGRYVHTTGILVKEAQMEWAVPTPLVREIDRVRLYAPSHRHVELGRNGYYFLATDTPKLMEFLADETRCAGAEVRFGSEFVGLTRSGEHIVLDGHGVGGRFLVGADGAHSKVAQAAGLDRNTRLLKGVEWEYEPIERAGDCLHCFVDPRRAPGYIGWVVPGLGVTQVGLAVNQSHRPDIAGFVEHLDARFSLRGARVVDKRGGMIPINGLLTRFHGDGVLLIGDAAGMVSPLTAGGIHRSYRFGRLAADAIADYLDGNAPNPGDVVSAAYRGDAWKQSARWCFDHLPLAACIELGLTTGSLFKRVAGKVFFDRFKAG